MPACNNCGAFVTPDFARVFGDNHNQVSACLDCETRNVLQAGGANARRAN
ncbi:MULTISPECIES: hypothetical protein [unclassified Haladaptatus]|nr:MULTISPECIES: hypothetical protein [unclassified Haladaptatus]